jgi:hypothetical protein
MKSKIAIAGFVFASTFAVAQLGLHQNATARTGATLQSSRDAATGQASGRKFNKRATEDTFANTNASATARDAATGQASGKRTHGSAQTSANSNAQLKGVAAGDVNGDGAVEQSADSNGSLQSSTGASASAGVKSPRDAASGQASGKRQHQPVKPKSDNQ